MNAIEVVQTAAVTPESHPSSGSTRHQASFASASRQPMKLEVVDLGPFQSEAVEIAIERPAVGNATEIAVRVPVERRFPLPLEIDHMMTRNSYRSFGINE